MEQSKERGFIIYSSEVMNVDVHINLWRCLEPKDEVLIDFGIMIHEMKNNSPIKVFVPFQIESIMNLGGILKDPVVMRILFNRDYEVTFPKQCKEFFIAENEGKKMNVCYNDAFFSTKVDKAGTIITIDVAKSTDLKNSLIDLEKSPGYFRFRITTTVDKAKVIFEKRISKDGFLRSEIDDTELVNLRINNSRDLTDRLIAVMNNENNSLCTINSVRLFVVVSAENNLNTNPENNNYSTRRIENELWHEYLKLNHLNGIILCYCWKSEKQENYSFLFELCQKRSDRKIIIIYILVLMMINIASNIVSTLITS